MEELKELKNEIETMKAKLRRFLEDGADMKDIMDVNLKIDDLILKFYRLKNSKG